MNYAERFKFVENTSYSNQVTVALWIAASAILAKAPSPQAEAWARATLKGAVDTDVRRLIMVRVASSPEIDKLDKPDAPLTDGLIQRIVDALVPELIGP